MSEKNTVSRVDDRDRRDFFKTAGKSIAVASAMMAVKSSRAGAAAPPDGAGRIASNTYAVRHLFKRVSRFRPPTEHQKQLKEKYGEITMLDFPQFTKDTYPGVNKMDLWSSLFGDSEDEGQFGTREFRGRTRRGDFEPSRPTSRKWLDKLASKIASTGVTAQHISNNAPRNISDLDAEKRREGIRIGKIWLDAAKQIGAKSMPVNTGGPRIAPSASAESGYPTNDEIVPYIKNAIESFKQLADYGEKVGVKTTIENHWGLSANPMNVRIILNEVNSPFLEASPDFCNWEHEYMLYHGLEALIPYASSMVHGKRWVRYPHVDIARCVEVLKKANYQGTIALEYETNNDDPVEGTRKLMTDIVAAL
ncbi:MAG: TIM barrel protein [Acidobacteria bacterium]|nr:TIM barrel protein [Acidobacteriota bacterium]